MDKIKRKTEKSYQDQAFCNTRRACTALMNRFSPCLFVSSYCFCYAMSPVNGDPFFVLGLYLSNQFQTQPELSSQFDTFQLYCTCFSLNSFKRSKIPRAFPDKDHVFGFWSLPSSESPLYTFYHGPHSPHCSPLIALCSMNNVLLLLKNKVRP